MGPQPPSLKKKEEKPFGRRLIHDLELLMLHKAHKCERTFPRLVQSWPLSSRLPPKIACPRGPMRCRGLPNGEILSVKLSANEDFAGNRDPCQRLWWIMDTRFFQGAYLGLVTSLVQAASRACYSWRVVELAPSQDLPRLRERDS